MASPITAADIVAQIRKRFGNRGSTNLDLNESVSPVATIADLDSPPFHGKNGFVAGITSAAVAAQFSYVTAFLDAGVAAPASRTVIRRVIIANPGGAMFVQIGILNDPNMIGSGVKAALTFVVVRTWDSVPAAAATDQLLAVTRIGSGQSATAVVLSNPILVLVPAANTLVIDGPWNLAPGNHLVVVPTGLNVALSASFYGDEYLVG